MAVPCLMQRHCLNDRLSTSMSMSHAHRASLLLPHVHHASAVDALLGLKRKGAAASILRSAHDSDLNVSDGMDLPALCQLSVTTSTVRESPSTEQANS